MNRSHQISAVCQEIALQIFIPERLFFLLEALRSNSTSLNGCDDGKAKMELSSTQLRHELFLMLYSDRPMTSVYLYSGCFDV